MVSRSLAELRTAYGRLGVDAPPVYTDPVGRWVVSRWCEHCCGWIVTPVSDERAALEVALGIEAAQPGRSSDEGNDY